jgi:hypothetical protein
MNPVVPSGWFQLGGQRTLALIDARNIEGAAAQDGNVGRAAILAVACGVLAE